MAQRSVGRAGAWLILVALAAPGCLNLRAPGPEDPEPVALPRNVTVTIEYRQPNGCLAEPSRCDGPVIFFGTWMRPGAEFPLTPDPAGTHVWTGRALGVPVNFPPRDLAYEVRIYDPYVQEDPGEVRFTARRLRIGGETVERIENFGGADEHGLIYIDDNGQGRSPF